MLNHPWVDVRSHTKYGPDRFSSNIQTDNQRIHIIIISKTQNLPFILIKRKGKKGGGIKLVLAMQANLLKYINIIKDLRIYI